MLRGDEPVGLLKKPRWPDFPDRAIYHDVARGRVPKLERLKELADLLSRFKINQLQLYIEHTLKFRRHPSIGKNASALVRTRGAPETAG